MKNTRMALCDLRGPLADLLDKLSGEDGELWNMAFKKFLRRENPWEISCRFPVFVDYDLSVEALIREGKYDWYCSLINSGNFRTRRQGRGELNLEFLHFGRRMRIGDIRAKLDEWNLRPGEIHELLAFGAQHPEEQKKFKIAALGTVSKDRVHSTFVASLEAQAGKRWLSLTAFRPETEWDKDCRFIAVAK